MVAVSWTRVGGTRHLSLVRITMHASIRALILIAALAVSLTACGGSSSPAAVVPPVLPPVDVDLDWDDDNWDERNWQ